MLFENAECQTIYPADDNFSMNIMKTLTILHNHLTFSSKSSTPYFSNPSINFKISPAFPFP